MASTMKFETGSDDFIRTCPTCGSKSVDYSILAGGSAKCKVCGWSGVTSDLVAIPVVMNAGSMEILYYKFMRELMKFMATHSLEIGKLLLGWGFLTNADTKTMYRYFSAMTKGMLVGIIEERERIEAEEVKSNG